MTSKDIDFDSALSNEFVLPTNKAVGATRILGEDGQRVTLFIKFSDSKYMTCTADKPCIYLAGNSLGALSKRSERLVQEELRAWATV
jgi:kynureninase